MTYRTLWVCARARKSPLINACKGLDYLDTRYDHLLNIVSVSAFLKEGPTSEVLRSDLSASLLQCIFNVYLPTDEKC